MQVNNVNSQNFTGVKYQYHNVTNAWFNYRLKQGGKSVVAKMAKIMEAQKDNPYHSGGAQRDPPRRTFPRSDRD